MRAGGDPGSPAHGYFPVQGGIHIPIHSSRIIVIYGCASEGIAQEGIPSSPEMLPAAAFIIPACFLASALLNLNEGHETEMAAAAEDARSIIGAAMLIYYTVKWR